MASFQDEIPAILREFLTYHESIRGHSKKTVDEYYLDLRLFFRFLKQRKIFPDKSFENDENTELEDISIQDVDLDFVRAITMTDVYDFLAFLSRERPQHLNTPNSPYGVGSKTRARKISAIKSFYKYLTQKTKQLKENPVLDLDSPKVPLALPRYLSLTESQELLLNVKGRNKPRDFCIIMLFLNCGLRISEVAGINLNDITAEALHVTGKGGKERTVYLNEACISAVNDYLIVRKSLVPSPASQRALFLSEKTATGEHNRISTAAIHKLVKKHLHAAGLSAVDYSSHKLRHTAATLMLKSGVDVRTLQELLGHEHLNTTQIYTHVEHEGLREAAMLNPLAEFFPPDS